MTPAGSQLKRMYMVKFCLAPAPKGGILIREMSRSAAWILSDSWQQRISGRYVQCTPQPDSWVSFRHTACMLTSKNATNSKAKHSKPKRAHVAGLLFTTSRRTHADDDRYSSSLVKKNHQSEVGRKTKPGHTSRRRYSGIHKESNRSVSTPMVGGLRL